MPMLHGADLGALIEQGCSLAIGGFGLGDAPPENGAVAVYGRGGVKRANKEHAEDDEGEDPLQSENLDGELLQRKG